MSTKLVNESSKLCVLVSDTSVSLRPGRNLLHHSLAEAVQCWWPPPVEHSTNYYLWTPSWHPAGGKSCQANWNCVFSVVKVFFLHRKKKEKKKDEAGQSGVLPLPATGCSLPVRFWDEPSGTAEVQIEALFPIRKAPDQAQLGVEPVLCAGGVHGVRPTLCGKGRAHGLFEVTNDHWECLWLDGKVLDFALGMANTHLSPLWTSIWSCWPWLAMLRPVLFIQWSPNLGSHASPLKQVGILQIPPCPWLWHTQHC